MGAMEAWDSFSNYGFSHDFKEIDVFTDYGRTRYLVAVKLEGFDTFKNQYLKYLELHLGYFSRGYSDDNQEKSRNIYLGLGINMSRVLKQFSWNRAATVTNYVQTPFTDIRLEKDLN